MLVLNDIAAVREWRAQQGKVAFVPTMGNLHEGHLHLVEQAKRHADTVIASIFVNPLQFGVGEDFEGYPRTFAEDCAKLTAVGASAVFAPTEQVLYPAEQEYLVTPPALADLWCGAVRPGHFAGVTTVLSKLFNIVQPQFGVFGKKDYQQLALIRGMVAQLNMPIDVVGIETQRAEDGLALSSRNGYLSVAERAEAPNLYRVISGVAQKLKQGYEQYRLLEQAAIDELSDRGWRVDYLAICDAHNLVQLPEAGSAQMKVVLVAATLGTTRLIDNVEICAA